MRGSPKRRSRPVTPAERSSSSSTEGAGARGGGEIGLAGVAPAIAAAVYHASGIRARSVPIEIETLLESRVR
jgi:CO/xanthine dehydrogenase Mo-binding subunit